MSERESSAARPLLTTAGLLGTGLAASSAHGVLIQRPDLDQAFEVNVDGTEFDANSGRLDIELVPGTGNVVVNSLIAGDLLSQSSLEQSFLGFSQAFTTLSESSTLSGTILALIAGGVEVPLPVPGQTLHIRPLSEVPGGGQPPLVEGAKSHVVFGFRNFAPDLPPGELEVLFGYFGFTYERIEETDGSVTARYNLSDFTFDDDPNATSLVVGQPFPFIDGDYNGDGFVSQADLDLVLLNWGSDALPSGWAAASQFDGVQISQNELDGVLLNWGNGTPPAGVAAVPEPAGLGALAAGLLFGGRRPRRS